MNSRNVLYVIRIYQWITQKFLHLSTVINSASRFEWVKHAFVLTFEHNKLRNAHIVGSRECNKEINEPSWYWFMCVCKHIWIKYKLKMIPAIYRTKQQTVIKAINFFPRLKWLSDIPSTPHCFLKHIKMLYIPLGLVPLLCHYHATTYWRCRIL